MDMDEDIPMPQHYYEEPDPAKALAMLEEEMATIGVGYNTELAADRNSEGVQRLRALLENECEAQALQMQTAPSRQSSLNYSSSMTNSLPISTRTSFSYKSWSRRGSAVEDPAAAGWKEQWAGLEEDVGASLSTKDPAEYAKARLSNVADTWKGMFLDPARYLNPGRHGEWTSNSGTGPAAGPAWGVSDLPPGLESKAADPKYMEAIRNQQLR
jgi:hypothetical protein